MRGAFTRGKLVYLAPLEISSVENYLKWFNDPEVTKYLAVHYPVNSFCERQYIENASRAGDQVPFDIFLVDGDRHIGNCALMQIDWVNRKCNFGIAIGEKDCWDKGYGAEVAELCVKYAFDRLNLHRVGLEVYDYNERGRRAYEKAGFQVEGREKESKYLDGVYYDTIKMSIINPRDAIGEKSETPGR
jgi:RimJ/RimL family protein N-acetyltransferase